MQMSLWLKQNGRLLVSGGGMTMKEINMKDKEYRYV
jgi:hypothetical protein